MDRHPPFHLGYTHKAAIRPHEPFAPAPPKSRARDLTARLRGLKALYDMERDRHLGLPARRRPAH